MGDVLWWAETKTDTAAAAAAAAAAEAAAALSPLPLTTAALIPSPLPSPAAHLDGIDVDRAAACIAQTQREGGFGFNKGSCDEGREKKND
jgi:hypothetical protein